MKKVGIIRRNELDKLHIISSLHRIGEQIVDIKSQADISIHAIDGYADPYIKLGGYHIQEFDMIIFEGMPAPVSRVVASRDQQYINQETEQALLAGLWQITRPDNYSQLIIINKGFVFAWNRMLYNPTSKLRWLGEIGWCTGTITSYYRFNENKIVQLRSPEPGDTNTCVLTLTANKFVFTPEPALNEMPMRLLNNLIKKTQQCMGDIGLDWCSIPILIKGKNIWAFGFSIDIPADLGMQDIDMLLTDVVNNKKIPQLI